MAATRSTFKSPAVRVLIALLAVGILGLFGAMLIRRESRTLRLPLIPTSAASLGFHASDTAFPTDKFDAIELPSKVVGWRTYHASYVAVWIDPEGVIYNLTIQLEQGTKEDIASRCAQLCKDLGLGTERLDEWIRDRTPESEVGIGLSKGDPGITVMLRRTLLDDRPWVIALSIFYPEEIHKGLSPNAKPRF